MSAAWFCPSCQKYHAPHCDTCPAGGEGTAASRPDGVLPFVGPWDQMPTRGWLPSTGNPPIDIFKGITTTPDPRVFVINGIAKTGGVQ